jgi:hypothetical protein
MPIRPGFSAIQKSVFECAMAGCNTIWIIANDDLSPAIRKLVGDWVYDPVYYSRPVKFNSEQRKEIPIYYVPIHPKDRDRRDSYGWSVLHGIHSAWRVSNNISHWLTPDKYFVSFPLSLYDIYDIREYRQEISSRNRNVFLSYDDKTVKDNLPLSFTMTGEDFKTCRRSVNKKTTREYLPPSPGQHYPTQKRPLHDRWSARHFNFEDIFGDIDESHILKVDLSWFCDLSSWSGYSDFIGSNFSLEIPKEELTKPHKHVKIPYTES